MSNTPSVKDNSINILFSQDSYQSTQRKGEGKPGRKRLPEGPRSPAGWRYRIKKDLLQRQGGRCAECHKRKRLRLYRIKEYTGSPHWSDYILVCRDCHTKNEEEERKRKREEQSKKRLEELKTRIWQRGPGRYGATPENSKAGFLQAIKPFILERDGNKCVFCETLGEKPKTEYNPVGVAALVPEKRGGKVCLDNYVACCHSHRASKGEQTALEFIWKKEFLPYCMDSDPEDEITVHQSAGGTRISLFLVAEVSRFLHRLTANKNGEISQFLQRITADSTLDMELKIEAEQLRSKFNELDQKLRSKAERLRVKLDETPEDKARRKKAERASGSGWI